MNATLCGGPHPADARSEYESRRPRTVRSHSISWPSCACLMPPSRPRPFSEGGGVGAGGLCVWQAAGARVGRWEKVGRVGACGEGVGG